MRPSAERESLQNPETPVEVVTQKPLGNSETSMLVPPTTTWATLKKDTEEIVFSSELVMSCVPGGDIDSMSHKDVSTDSERSVDRISRPLWRLRGVRNGLKIVFVKVTLSHVKSVRGYASDRSYKQECEKA